MHSLGGLVGRIGLIGVAVFFIFANISFFSYRYVKFRSKNNPESASTSLKFFFAMFVSSLMGMMLFMMVTIFVYVYFKLHPGEIVKSLTVPVPTVAEPRSGGLDRR